jgi:hypothetical protein
MYWYTYIYIGNSIFNSTSKPNLINLRNKQGQHISIEYRRTTGVYAKIKQFF